MAYHASVKQMDPSIREVEGDEKGYPFTQEDRAVLAHLRQQTVALIDPDTKTVGSAVAIQLGDTFFLATAAHVLRDAPNVHVVLRAETPTIFNSFRTKQVDLAHDVAFLEIPRQDAYRIAETYCTIEDLCTEEVADGGDNVLLVGYPGQLIDVDDSVEIDVNTISRVYDHRTITYGSFVIPVDEWPTTGFRYGEPDKQFEFFVGFDPETRLAKVQIREEMSLPEMVDISTIDRESRSEVVMGGASGGGIWAPKATLQGGVWRPQCLLIGLLSTCYPKGRWLRCKSIQNWLSLVERHYPDLVKAERTSA